MQTPGNETPRLVSELLRFKEDKDLQAAYQEMELSIRMDYLSAIMF